MKISVHADKQAYEQLTRRGVPEGVMITRDTDPEADIFFDLSHTEQSSVFDSVTDRPVFVNAVITTCKDLRENHIRLNGWNSLLERDILELAENKNPFFSTATAALDSIGWKYQLAPDTPGMISARIIAMIINEAYYALGEKVSTKAEIDIAMRTGTNYPYGPFEWAEKIGLQHIYDLLQRLGENNKRYTIAPALADAIQEIQRTGLTN